MAQIISVKNNIELERVNCFTRERESPDVGAPVPIQVIFTTHVHHYAYDHSETGAVDLASRVVAGHEKREAPCGCYNLRELSSSKEILSKTMCAVNPSITPGTDFHDKIVDKILQVVNRYSPYLDGSIKRLDVEVRMREDLYNRCECKVCRAMTDSIEKLVVPASESSIKKLLKRVRVEAAAYLEEDQDDEVRQRKRRRRNKSGGARRPSDKDECTICSDEFTAGKYAAQMPCLHSFHKPCIATWLRQSHLCPLCRYKMPVANDQEDR